MPVFPPVWTGNSLEAGSRKGSPCAVQITALRLVHVVYPQYHVVGMEFRRFGLKRYKGYAQQVDVDLAPLTILVGPNNAGKTALAQAIQLLAGGLAASDRDALEPLPLESGGLLGLRAAAVPSVPGTAHPIRRCLAFPNSSSERIPCFRKSASLVSSSAILFDEDGLPLISLVRRSMYSLIS